MSLVKDTKECHLYNILGKTTHRQSVETVKKSVVAMREAGMTKQSTVGFQDMKLRFVIM
jgi:hypothetical protein